MEGRALGMLAAFAMIACFAGGLSYWLEIDSKRRDLDEAQSLLASNKGSLETKRVKLDTERAKVQGFREQIDHATTLGEAKENLTGAVAALEAQRADVTKEFITAVEKVRVGSAGLSWPDVKLVNGQTLQGVTIQRVTESDVSFSHAGGVTKVVVADLPSDIKARFRYGMVPMTPASMSAIAPKPAAGTAPAMASGGGYQRPIPAPAPAPPPPAPVGPSISERDELYRNIQEKVLALESKIKSLEKTRADWADKAAQHRALGAYAQYKGRPSSAHFANAHAADQQAALVSAQIDAVHNEIYAVRSKAR
jgi:hypothetical protein